ncbi:sensor histidine kinase [Streptomyces acidiscabies]|uniref:histidine kinase n=2 Tax=Streptomyces acidiscabies TaxID=42234 RepID=A0AAP6EGI5_9ACTN|nr:HAMP domain-containing sensor histidine kinase [Streptomyces acidiscabies]MDX2961864.1 HAMP domain-containing sensor histidine kinase [Streptomyces acidiscabies]MDX3023389.1 HAMP domain-containing sensor histidine kinase [Streptomyces acidiscabies]MDX3789405.1 HAMP domain-containing sensor histidine kinase [Streptomyces acidiscabies]GAQ50388.1 putative sensor histidine kinase TcrY [Streptomyces acidiscabies]GAV37291.1 putative sensor histidine kinase TcrY [Streptomyces acidiscabies]
MRRRPSWPRTLRARLTAGLVVLLAISCAAVGVAAVLELGGFLTGRLDQQLRDAGARFPASLEHGGTSPSDHDGDEDGDTRLQPAGTFGARLVDGAVTHAAVVASGGGTRTVTLGARDLRDLAGLPADGRGHTVGLSALGGYRMLASAGRDGDVLVTGLPTEPVEAAVHRLELVCAVVFGAALAAAGVAGALWVRWSLRPLGKVAATATRVSELPLAGGETDRWPRPPEADPRSEVGRLAAAFATMLRHVENALSERHASQERLRGFAADASHELRTPVASVRGHAELALLHPGPVPPEVTRALERIEAEAARMGEMVDDLLLLARLDAGRPLEHHPVDLTRLVLDAVTDAQAAGPGHRWALELPEEPVTVTGDAHRLHQIPANLLANARLHTPPGTTVTVSLTTDGTRTLLTVHDDGPGIPEDMRPRVFERFTHGERHRTEDAQGGTGLGLSIVAALAQAHGGDVTLESRPGATTFTVRLPAGRP